MAETLTDLLRIAVQRHDASGRRLADLASQRGLDITHTTINHILSGRYRSRPGQKTLDAIAALADVSRDRVYAAAGIPLPGPPFTDELPPGVDYLTGRQRAAVIEVIRAMLEPRTGETAGEEEFVRAFTERLNDQAGTHSREERLAALDQAAEVLQKSRSLSASTKALIAETIADIREHMRQDRTG